MTRTEERIEDDGGTVKASLSRGGRDLVIGRAGRTVLRYTGLLATDAGGRALHAWLALDGGRLLLRVDAAGARYPLRIDPLIQQGEKLTGAGGIGPGRFGYSVALSADGDTALIGGWRDNGGAGAAWVFVGSPTTSEAAGETPTTETVAAPPAHVTSTSTSSSAPGETPLPAPVVQNARQSATSWRAGNRLARVSRARTLTGTTFSFSLNEQATVTFSFGQSLSGRRVGGKCVTPTAKNRSKPACRRTARAGTLTFTGHSGANKVAFQGRISSSRKLKPGRYTLLITATNSAGVRSEPRSLSFTIVK